jgi:hypothetical protein
MKLLDRLSNDGRSWADAEVTLARAEVRELKQQAIRAAGFAVVGVAAVFSAMLALTQAGIALLSPHVGGEGFAALTVTGLLGALVILCFYLMRNSISWQADSILLRWFTRRPPPETM